MHALEDRFDVLGLVVGGHDHEHAHAPEHTGRRRGDRRRGDAPVSTPRPGQERRGRPHHRPAPDGRADDGTMREEVEPRPRAPRAPGPPGPAEAAADRPAEATAAPFPGPERPTRRDPAPTGPAGGGGAAPAHPHPSGGALDDHHRPAHLRLRVRAAARDRHGPALGQRARPGRMRSGSSSAVLLEVGALVAYAELTHTVLSPGRPPAGPPAADQHVEPGGQPRPARGHRPGHRRGLPAPARGRTSRARPPASAWPPRASGSAVVLNVIFWLALVISHPAQRLQPPLRRGRRGRGRS